MNYIIKILFICFIYVTTIIALDVKLYGLNYGISQAPHWSPNHCKTQEQVVNDMKILKTVTERIRIYSLTGCDQGIKVIEAIKQTYPLKLWLGIWIGKVETLFLQELNTLNKIIQIYKNELNNYIVGIHVGSEVLYRNDMTAEKAIEYMNKIKKLVTDNHILIPISISDVAQNLLENKQILNAVDIVTVNKFPFWEKITLNATSMIRFHRIIKKIKSHSKNKELIITETGWASHGYHKNASVASPKNSAEFLKQFHRYATKYKIGYYYFAAFDALWQNEIENNTVEAHFGLFHINGTMKKEFRDLKIKQKPIKKDKRMKKKSQNK